MSVAQIAAAIGVTAPSIYRHFPDKQTMLAEAVLGSIERMETIVDPELAFHDFLAELASAAVARPDSMVLWRWETVHLETQWREKMRTRAAVVFDHWTTRLRHHRPTLTEDQADLVARAVSSTVSSALRRSTRLSPTKHAALLAGIANRIVEAAPYPSGPAPPAAKPHAAATTGGPRREQILDAAASLFRRRGFAAVGVDELGAAVGITGPSVYRHFPDKQAILIEVCQRAMASLSAQTEAELRDVPSDHHEERLRALIKAQATVLLRSPDLVVAGHIGPVDLAGPEGDEARAFLRSLVGCWSSALLGVEESLSQAEAQATVYAAFTIGNDLARSRFTRNRPGLYGELVGLMTAALGLAAQD